jgi:hypothetical protein
MKESIFYSDKILLDETDTVKRGSTITPDKNSMTLVASMICLCMNVCICVYIYIYIYIYIVCVYKDLVVNDGKIILK